MEILIRSGKMLDSLGYQMGGGNMEKFFEDFLQTLEAQHAEIENALEGLPQAGLDWPPRREMNSIAVLIVHLAGSERYWIGDVIAGDPSNRVREREFQPNSLVAEELKYKLSDSLAYIRNQLSAFSVVDLPAPRTVPHNGREVTVGWALLHTLEHTALHLGHIQLTRQLWRQRQIAKRE
jgi:uncharacterized damage-inducible protein DinB